MLLQLTNAGAAPIVIKDQEGYTGFVAEVAPSTTEEVEVTTDLLQRLSSQLVALETPTYAADGTTILVALRWAVVASDARDDRTDGFDFAGAPTLTEFQGAAYSTTAGATNAVVSGTNLLGDQVAATLSVEDAAGTMEMGLVATNPGAAGNDITCTVITPASTLLVSVVGNAITVRPASGGSTIAAIVSAINTHANARLLVQATTVTGGTLNEAVAVQSLTGGKGPGVSLSLGGTACVLVEVSDTSATFDIPAGISTSSYSAPLEFRNGPHVSRLTVPVVGALAAVGSEPKLTLYGAASYSTGSGNTGVVITGTGLLADQVKATLLVEDALQTMGMTLEAVTPGVAGNAITCEVITPASTLAITVVGSAITVRPASGGSTIAAIAAAINADAAALLLVQATATTGGTLNEAVADQNLAGGAGPGVSLKIGSTACEISECTATQITANLPTGTGANGNITALTYTCGQYSTQLSIPVVT